jgi:hypothetical protein
MLIKNERSANTMPPLRDRDINFAISILLLMISGPTALLASKVEIISKISCSLTIICERTFLHLTSKGGKI